MSVAVIGVCVSVVAIGIGYAESSRSANIQQQAVSNQQTAAQIAEENQANLAAGQIAVTNSTSIGSTDASLYNSQYSSELSGAAQSAQTAIAANDKAAQAQQDLLKEITIGAALLITGAIVYNEYKITKTN